MLRIALDDIRSHHNVGAVFRSADAFGIKEVILGGITPRPPHRDIQKAALGATESVDWQYAEILVEHLRQLKSQEILIIGIEQVPASISIDEFNIPNHDICLVMGNEVKGISKEILEMCDRILEIPQKGIKKSLNISVCAGILMYHFTRP